MTRDLDQRLADALDSAARTIPDNAVPPQAPELAARRARRPKTVLVVALAAAAVIAAVAIPVAISKHEDKGEVAGAPCPAAPSVKPLPIVQQKPTGTPPPSEFDAYRKMPFGGPPRSPFTMTTKDSSYLEDRGVRVPLEARYSVTSLGRIHCGWLVFRELKGGASGMEIGALSTSGAFRLFAPSIGDGFALSPDGTQAVWVTPGGNGKGRLTVRDVATGKETASYPTDPETEVTGWNTNGIWFMPHRQESQSKVWKPGSDPVPVDTSGRRLTAYQGTDRVLLTEGVGTKPCVLVAVLNGSRLKTVWQNCGASMGTLSPDGRVVVVGGNSTKGYLVDTGAKTRLARSAVVLGAGYDAIWEDATHLLSQGGIGNGRSVTIRCDVISNACERIQDSSKPGVSAGPRLGYP